MIIDACLAAALVPVIGGPYKLSDAREAFRHFASGNHKGKGGHPITDTFEIDAERTPDYDCFRSGRISMRRSLLAAAVILLTFTPLAAVDAIGTIRRIDIEKGWLFMNAGGQDRAVRVFEELK